MAVQFFFADPQESYGKSATEGYELGQKMRKGEIERDLARTYNEHVVTEPQYDSAGNVTARPGDLNAAGFIKSAQERGLPMQESMQYLAHQKALRDAQLDQAQTDNMIRASGENPSPTVTGRAGAPIGNPPTSEEAYLKTADKADKSSLEDWFANMQNGQKPQSAQAPVAPTAEEVAANDKLVAGLRSPSEVGKPAAGITHEDVAKVLGIGGAQAPQVSADGTQMDLGSGVIQGSRPTEKPVEEAKLQAPGDWTGGYVPSAKVPDTRTAGQAVQDTYNPEAIGAAGTGAVKPSDIFDYAKVTNVGDVKIKQGIDAALAKLGQDQSQVGVDRLMAIAAQSVPVPQLTGKTGEAYSKYLEARQAYPAKVLEAQRKVASDLAAGNTGAIAEQMGREQLGLSKEQFALATRQNDRAEQQVSHPAIKGYLPSNTEKVALTDASGAVRELQDQMKHVPSPNTAEWQAFQTILAKSVVKAMSLPVGEGLLDEVASKIQNGASTSGILDALRHGGLSEATSNAAYQVMSTALGLNTIAGANRLAEGATEFARKKWSAYGEGSDFNKYFPTYTPVKDKGDNTPAPVTPPKPVQPAKPEAKQTPKPKAHKEGDTWSDANFNYRFHNGKIQRKAK